MQGIISHRGDNFKEVEYAAQPVMLDGRQVPPQADHHSHDP